MICPSCRIGETRVIDSRPIGTQESKRIAMSQRGTRRRRRCDHCRLTFTTYEIPVEAFNQITARLTDLRDACTRLMGEIPGIQRQAQEANHANDQEGNAASIQGLGQEL